MTVMSTYAFDSLRGLIQARYASLSVVDRKMADVVLAREKDLLAYSATELAGHAGVSKASAARFFRRLGFADYQAFRLHLRDTATTPSPLTRLSQRGGRASPLEQHVAREVAHLQAMATHVTDDDVLRAVRWLLAARRVWVVGYRNGYMAAFYATALLSQVRPGVELLNEGAGEDAERLADIQTGDVLLAMDFRRRTRRLPQVAAFAVDAGARLLLITDARVSALTGLAAVAFTCPPQEETVFDSYAPVVSLIHFLASAALDRATRKAQDRLARIEKAHQCLSDLED